MPNFKQRLRELRERNNETQKQIGVIVGKGESTVRMWELGKSAPSHDVLKLLAAHFDVSVDYLLGMDDINPENRSYAFKSEAGFHYFFGGLAGIMEDFERLDETDKKNLLSYARFLLSADKYKPPISTSLEGYDAPVYEATFNESGDSDGNSEISDT